jgi:hypothetical protein
LANGLSIGRIGAMIGDIADEEIENASLELKMLF